MALKATVHKVDLAVSDMDRGYYASHALTLARHPSETSERMMGAGCWRSPCTPMRCWYTDAASPPTTSPRCGRKTSPAISSCGSTSACPTNANCAKRCGRRADVVLITYGGRGAGIWWNANAAALERLTNLDIIDLSAESTQAMAKLVDRTMQINVSIQDGQIFIGNAQETVLVEPVTIRRSAANQ